MKLTTVRITKYRPIEDSTEIQIEPDVTCLVGKNESGKTAVLQALRRLNPTEAVVFKPTDDYPRQDLTKYENREDKTKQPIAVEATFVLEPLELAEIESKYGAGVMRGAQIHISRDYGNVMQPRFDTAEDVFVGHLIKNASELDQRTLTAVKGQKTVDALAAALAAVVDKSPSVQAFEAIVKQHAQKHFRTQIWELLKPVVPKFMYFGDYDNMKGAASFEQLKTALQSTDSGLKTLGMLFDQAGVKPETLVPGAASSEANVARLEAIGVHITSEVFRYWKQNQDLEVRFTPARASGDDAPFGAGTDILKLRVYNPRHKATVPFDERSKGFVWFFSFLARFEYIARSGEPVILLLDEPGLSLHADAQADFLGFINERLADKGYQVIYTTHSPFMLEPDRLHRVRTVEDMPGKGTVVSSNWLRSDKATSFPLQAAMGVSVTQGLFVGPNNLLVEGASDLMYLQAMSEVLESKKKKGLSRKWIVLPVGGADRLGYFAAFLQANRLNVVALLDVDRADKQRIEELIKKKILDGKRVLRVADFLDTARPADIEDLFDLGTYLALVNEAYHPHPPLDVDDLPPGDRVTKRVEAVLKERGVERLNHYKPAEVAARRLASMDLPAEVIARFQKLFERINAFLPKA